MKMFSGPGPTVGDPPHETVPGLVLTAFCCPARPPLAPLNVTGVAEPKMVSVPNVPSVAVPPPGPLPPMVTVTLPSGVTVANASEEMAPPPPPPPEERTAVVLPVPPPAPPPPPPQPMRRTRLTPAGTLKVPVDVNV
jgi:hypothetical protein